MQLNRVLITGGLGYIGSRLAQLLLESGYKVRIIDTNYFGSTHLAKEISIGSIEYIEADIRDKNVVDKSLSDVDAVIHLAAISDDPCVELNEKISEQINFDASLYLLKKSKQVGVQRFINASSSTVYGVKKEKRVHEGLILAPISIYGKLKAKYEPYVEELNDKNFTTVSLRPGTVCGLSPRQRFDLLVNVLTINALINKKIMINGGEQYRTNITNNDMVNIYKLMLEVPDRKIAGEIFNVSFENYTVLQTAEIVKDVIGNDIKIEVKNNMIDKRSYRLDSTKFIKHFEYKQLNTVRGAVSEIVAEYEKGHFQDGLTNDKYYDIRILKNRYATTGKI